jgi:hypothetical protein
MRQITPILKKKNRCRQILILSVCILTLISCNKFDSLPDKIKATYSLAIPIVDTTVSLGDFADIKSYGKLLESIDIPEGDTIEMGEQAYPFYIGDYSSSQEIEWVEPKIIIVDSTNSTDLPSGTKINIKIYTKNASQNVYFWLRENYPITWLKERIIVPETPQQITNIEQFRSARTIYLNTSIIYPTKVSGRQIVSNKVHIKFSIKFAIKTDLKVNV